MGKDDFRKNYDYGTCGGLETQFMRMCAFHSLANALGICIPVKNIPKFIKDYQRQLKLNLNSFTHKALWNLNYYYRRRPSAKNDYFPDEIDHMQHLTKEEAAWMNTGIYSLSFLKYIVQRVSKKRGDNMLILVNEGFIHFDGGLPAKDHLFNEGIGAWVVHPNRPLMRLHEVGGIILSVASYLFYPNLKKYIDETNIYMVKREYPKEGEEKGLLLYSSGKYAVQNFNIEHDSWDNHIVAFYKSSDYTWCFKDTTDLVAYGLDEGMVYEIITGPGARSIMMELPEETHATQKRRRTTKYRSKSRKRRKTRR